MSNVLLASGLDWMKTAVKPLYEFLNTGIPIMIGLFAAVCIIFAIMRFVAAARAEDDGEAKRMRKQGIYCIITIIVMVVILAVYVALREPLMDYIGTQMGNLTE